MDLLEPFFFSTLRLFQEVDDDSFNPLRLKVRGDLTIFSFILRWEMFMRVSLSCSFLVGVMVCMGFLVRVCVPSFLLDLWWEMFMRVSLSCSCLMGVPVCRGFLVRFCVPTFLPDML